MVNEELAGNQRRLRHIQGIYVKNLTPFPLRDHASSALQQTTLAPILHFSDDTDLVLARRRSRRISQSSIVTLRTMRPDSHVEESNEKSQTPDSPRTARTRPLGPPVSFPRAGPSNSPPTHLRRQRSTSRASLGSSQGAAHSRDPSINGIPTCPITSSGSFPYDLSQRNLEKLMSSRLVETFVTLTIPETRDPKHSTADKDRSPSSPTDRSPARGLLSKKVPPSKPTMAKHSRLSSASSPVAANGEHSSSSRLPNTTVKRTTSTLKSKEPTANGSAGTLSVPSKSVIFPGASSQPSSRSASPARSPVEDCQATIPFFISPIHRPSTNPCWSDLDASVDFAEWTDRHQSRVVVTLWGRVDGSSASAWSNVKGKAKNTDSEETSEGNWKVLFEWDVQMGKLEKVEASVLDRFDVLPSNTLLFSLSPTGDLYFLPPDSPEHPSSPTAYASDSELASPFHKSKPPTRDEILQQSRRETRMKQSATWADVVKLSNLYAVVRDTKTSLNEVIRNTNKLIEQAGPNVLGREVSEREEKIRSFKQEVLAAKKGCAAATQDIQDRIEQLRARREALRTAFDMYDQDVKLNNEESKQVDSARATYHSIHNALTPHRTTLCDTLDFIFPIEPDPERAADLVFTILEVPLSVPVAPSDPAPPLDNEEAVSAALGYAAHVVALLSSYMNVRLPYPVTYVGSRSYVRDPISATMHGPRMFPLNPTGVDTYRFEYAVFLLNKDIETLMAEQGLRAADLRHTLPNLKNLILTLTHNSDLTTPTVRVAPAIPAPLAEETAPTPRAASPAPTENTPAPAPSRSSFLSPLAAILRSRYTGTPSRPKVVVDLAEPAERPDVQAPAETESPQTARPENSPASSLGNGDTSSTGEPPAHQVETKGDSVPTTGLEKLGNNPPVGTPPTSPLSHTVS